MPLNVNRRLPCAAAEPKMWRDLHKYMYWWQKQFERLHLEKVWKCVQLMFNSDGGRKEFIIYGCK